MDPALLVECLAVVGRNCHESVLELARLFETFHDPRHLVVDVVDAPVVEVLQLVEFGERSVAALILLHRVVQVPHQRCGPVVGPLILCSRGVVACVGVQEVEGRGPVASSRRPPVEELIDAPSAVPVEPRGGEPVEERPYRGAVPKRIDEQPCIFDVAVLDVLRWVEPPS